jgi:hypothetical protein
MFAFNLTDAAFRRGRKRACITYCVSYILSCITKHSPEYKILMIGRILGGVATSLLFSAFESWLVAEHNKVTLTSPQICLSLSSSPPNYSCFRPCSAFSFNPRGVLFLSLYPEPK